jgi:hypothetical protein
MPFVIMVGSRLCLIPRVRTLPRSLFSANEDIIEIQQKVIRCTCIGAKYNSSTRESQAGTQGVCSAPRNRMADRRLSSTGTFSRARARSPMGGVQFAGQQKQCQRERWKES